MSITSEEYKTLIELLQSVLIKIEPIESVYEREINELATDFVSNVGFSESVYQKAKEFITVNKYNDGLRHAFICGAKAGLRLAEIENKPTGRGTQ